MLLLCALIVGSNAVWGATGDPDWSYTVVNGDANKLNTTTTTFTVDATHVFNYSSSVVGAGTPGVTIGSANSTYGIKLGSSGSNYFNPVIFKTDAFKDYAVTKVRLYLKHNGTKAGALTVKQGSVIVGAADVSSTNSWTTVTSSETNDGEGGTLEIKYEVAQALYINKIEVWYKELSGTKHTLSSAVSPSATGSVTLGSSSIIEGKTTTISADPEEGYYFVNWTVTGTGASVTNENAASTTFTMGTSDATVTANFAEINFWAVTYDYNDGVTDDEEVHVLKAEAASYNLKAAPSREDYSFTGWKIGATTYAAGAAYEPTANVTVQAQWEFNGTLYSYNRSNKNDLATGAKYVMGASYTSSGTTTWKYCQAMGSDTYLHAAVVGEHGSLDADDAVFFDETPEIITLNETADGWTMTNESGKKIGLKGDKQLGYDTGDQTWDLEGTDNIPTFSAQYTKSGTLTTYIMKFNWNSGNSRFNAYTSGQQDVYFYRLDDGKDVYTLTLNFKDGATDNGTHRVLEGASYTLTAPTRSGYAFNGWNTEEDGTGTPYAAGSYTMQAANTTLYAQWVATVVTPSSETDKHYATFCAPYKTKLDAGVMAYIGTYASSTLTLHVLEDSETGTVIPANTPVVLKATSADAFNVVATTDDASAVQDGTLLTASNLHGTLAATAAPANAYVLGYNSAAGQETGFYQFSGTIPANRAYLIISGGAAQAAGIRIVEGESNATNVENIEANDEVVKFIENGQLLIKRDGITYDALGRIVE